MTTTSITVNGKDIMESDNLELLGETIIYGLWSEF